MAKKTSGAQGLFESFFQRLVPNEVAGGKGRFGFEASNPVPVAGIQGEYLYMSRLRTGGGERVLYRHGGSCYAPNSLNEIDRFLLTNAAGREVCELYMDRFHVGNSQRAPEGFTLD